MDLSKLTRDKLVYHMHLCKAMGMPRQPENWNVGVFCMLLLLEVSLRSYKLNPWLQRHMWSTVVTLNSMVLVVTMLKARYLMNT